LAVGDRADGIMARASEAARPAVVGVLLAGGQARRMGGGDKNLRPLGGRPILARVIARTAPQVRALVLNANGDPQRFAAFGLPVAADLIAGFAGPLAGVLTGMAWARTHRPDCPWIATIATDTPFFPLDLVARLLAAVEVENAELACAASGGRAHPVFGLWPVGLEDQLRAAMEGEDIRKVDVWTARYRLAMVEFPTAPVDPFFNTNRPEDLAEAERLLRSENRDRRQPSAAARGRAGSEL
jgi:molybdopterin-guanine dinucleotide biosynthesis protein A